MSITSRFHLSGRRTFILVVGLVLVVTALVAIGLSLAIEDGPTPVAPDPTATPCEPTALPPTATPSPPPTFTPTRPPTSTAIPTATPTATATLPPIPEQPPQAFLDLEERLARSIAAHPAPAELAIAVTDLQTGHTIDVGGDRPHYSACVMNMFVIIEATRMVQDGELAMAEIERLVRVTTWSSNAATAYQLYGIVGGGSHVAGVERVAALLEELGMDDAIINHPPGYPAASRGVDTNNWLTARGTNRALELLYHNEILDPAHTAFVLSAMSEVKPGLNYATAASVPPGVVVSHKNGFFPSDVGYIDNDVGIVRFWRGEQEYAYAVSFFSQYNPIKYSQLPLGQSLMADIWAYFAEAYP
jgi:beta-lactamase class A